MASKGIALPGEAIALRLADDGFDVAVNDIPSNSAALGELVDEIKAKGRASSAHPADISVEDQVRGMVEQVVHTYGQLNIVRTDPVNLLVTTALWDHVMDINAKGTFLCYKYAGIQMIKQGKGGRIIGASSVLGKQGHEFNFAYTASKFAVRGLTQAAGKLYVIFGYSDAMGSRSTHTHLVQSTPICVSSIWLRRIFSLNEVSVAQGATDEIPYDTVKETVSASSWDHDAGTNTPQFGKKSPLGIIGAPTDIANLVTFIVSKESQFITVDAQISINGGVFFD
ncbi:hypothetical protein C8R44DRAFT_916202 [Mycena epipterygia]|nr:hypothetical protein C8R44DRAFT_916202 [Mycena epipterygia]